MIFRETISENPYNNEQMADIVSKAKRSEIMSKIRSRGNKRTELAMVKLLRANKITGWRRHYPIIEKPDLAFPTNGNISEYGNMR